MRHKKCDYYGGRCIYCGSPELDYDPLEDDDA